MKLKRGSTSVRRLIFVADSSSTVGAGLANLTYNSASLVAYYFAGDLSNEVQIALATSTLGTWASGGFVAVDNTNMPGWYEIGIPDAALDGGNECSIQLRGATNMVPVNIYIELDAVDYQTAVFGASTLTQTQVTGGAYALNSASFAFNAALDFTTTQKAATLARVTLVDTTTTNTDMRGTDNAALSATALSTAVWTATIANRIDVAVSTRLAPLVAGRDISVAATTGAVELDSATGTKIDAILEDTGTTLPAAIAAIDAGGSGTGARTVTITVNDGTTALQNATVRMTEGANTFTALTNVSGVAVFNLDDATYTVGVTKSGYSYAGTTLIVNGTETATYSMTQVSVTSPTNPSLSAIEVLCLGADFTASAGIDIDFRMAVIPSSDQNNAFPGAKVTVTSNVSGIARWEAPQGAAIEYKRGRADVWTSVTLDSDSVTNVTSVIGSP